MEHIGLRQICLLLGQFLEWIVGAFSDLLDVAAETGEQCSSAVGSQSLGGGLVCLCHGLHFKLFTNIYLWI